MKDNNNEVKKIQFIKLESVKIIIGLILVSFGLYVTIAAISYFFTGGADQSQVQYTDLNTTDEIKTEIHNWTGYRGAKLSDFLLARTFGIPVLFMIYFCIRIGLKLTGYLKLNTMSSLISCLFFMLWGSFFLSLVGAQNSFFNFGGQCGVSEVNWFEAQVGLPGALLFLFITLFIYAYVYKGLSISEMKEKVTGPLSFIKKDNSNENEIPDFNQEEQSNSKKQENTEVVDSIIDENTTQNQTQITDIIDDTEDSTDLEDIAAEESDDIKEENKDVEFVINNNQNQESLVAAVDEEEEQNSSEDSETEDADKVYKDLMDRLGPYDPTAELPDFKMPTLDLLQDYDLENAIDVQEQTENKNRIKQVLNNFGIEITSISATVGPTITLYEIVPAPGIRISKIQSLGKDIALSLAAKGIRIIAPIPGKGTIGIEVPNKKPQIVPMRSVLASKAFQESKMELPIAFGRTITNEVFMVDLAKTPHLLVAGATGMGKSVGLNVLLTSLLYKKHPSTLKLVMVDPKQVEFSIYEKIEKHYLAKLPGDSSAIITDTTKVIQTLTSLTTEMENRYTLLADVHLRNIKEYNAKFISRKINPAKELPNGLTHHYLPYIVVVIDEYGDLLMTAGKEIETPIARIAQKARAVGIHMVIATQRPSVKIVTGTIKANFPARLAFRVASRIDSQTILDAPGAQELVGKGDMLYSTGGAENTRVQCAFVDTPEVETVNDFICEQQGYPEAYRLPEYVDENGDVVGAVTLDTKSLDPRLREAAELVVNCQNGSTSNIQRTLEVGFNRAGRIMDQLEAIGVVGPVCGSKPRQVMVQYLDDLDIIFNNINK